LISATVEVCFGAPWRGFDRGTPATFIAFGYAEDPLDSRRSFR